MVRKEIEARIKDIKKIIFNEDEEFILCVEIEWMKQILNKDKIVLKENYIDINSFRNTKKDNEYIRKNGIDYDDLKKC